MREAKNYDCQKKGWIRRRTLKVKKGQRDLKEETGNVRKENSEIEKKRKYEHEEGSSRIKRLRTYERKETIIHLIPMRVDRHK